MVAHELLYGLTDHTARLEYRFEAGALNESLSDIFGIIITNFDESDIEQWNWEMGEDLSNSGIQLRNRRDPTRRGQPVHMADFVVLLESNDHGGCTPIRVVLYLENFENYHACSMGYGSTSACQHSLCRTTFLLFLAMPCVMHCRPRF